MLCSLYRVLRENERLSELIQGFNFNQYCQTEISQLSTGNKKKVFLIAGFYLKRALLILDEPFDGLDFEATEYLYQCLRAYKNYGTVLMSPHFAESVGRVCDRLYLLEEVGLEFFQGDLTDWLAMIQLKGVQDVEGNL